MSRAIPSGVRGAEGTGWCLRHRDVGAGSVLVLSVLAVGLAAALAVGALAQVVLARHQAEAAADLAALAAADVALGRATGDPCQAAARVASGNGAVLVTCRLDSDGSVTVRASVQVRGAGELLGPARGAARAGPAP